MARTVLIVDDVRANLQLLRNALEDEYTVIEATNGQQAQQLIMQNSQLLSAVLLDIVMPQMDGYALLAWMRSQPELEQLPVIMITGAEDERSHVKALSLGASDFIIKPYRPDVIKHCLNNCISLKEAAAMANTVQRDKLTGLYNREAFFEKAGELIARQEPGYYLLASFDIDNFKYVNDQYGAAEGDRILRHIAKQIQKTTDQVEGLCGRIYGDNFAALYPNREEYCHYAEQQRQTGFIPSDTMSSLHFSVGRYAVSDLSLSVSTMFDRAYLAKQSVKGRYGKTVAYFDDEMLRVMTEEREIISRMDSALDRGEFEVWFQPQYNHGSGALIGAEALVRWQHAEKGLLTPGLFIPVFEKNGFVYELDKYVWGQVCLYLRKWLDEGRRPLPVSVNISRYDVFMPDLVEELTALMQKYRLPVELLRLEITESAFSHSPEHIVNVVKRLVSHGFTVEIDDFGSGYSSLNTLKNVPAQVVKLDMRFLDDDDGSQRGGNILESVVRMTRWLGMSVIAEGVEDKAQADFLRSIGCNYVQGYLYARPMPLADYEDCMVAAETEERLLNIEAVENHDNNSFWDPHSMDTLIFNSYVGGACIFEYHNGSVELLRVTDKYVQVISSAGMTIEQALKLNWAEYMDAATLARFVSDIEESYTAKKEITAEYAFLDLPNCPATTYLRTTMRVIATTGGRQLVYCSVENITAQRELQQREHMVTTQLQNMMNDMPGGFVRLSYQPGGKLQPLYFNQGLEKLSGMSREELTELFSTGALAAIHPQDQGLIREMVEKMLSNGEASCPRFRLLQRSGDYIWLSGFGRVSHDLSGETYLNIYYSDAGEQVKQEETQKLLLDNLPGGAGIYEFKQGQINLVYQNKSYWQLVGLGEEVYPDEAALSAIHPDDAPIIMRELAAAIEQGRDLGCDIRLRHLTRGYSNVHLAGRVIPSEQGGFLIYATFTPLPQEGLSYQQMLPLLLSTIMESSNDYAFAKDRDFRYICCSPAFLQHTGLSSESDVVGKTDRELFSAEMAQQFHDNDLALLKSGLPLIDYEETVQLPDGTLQFCKASKHLLRDATGEIIGVYGVSRDITRERSAFEQLRLVNDNIPCGLATYRFERGRLHITYCNDGFYRLFGGTREGFVSRGEFDPMEWIFESDLPQLLQQVSRFVSGGAAIDCLFRIHVVGGGFKWVNIKAVASERRNQAVLFNAALFDVTDRQEAMERLRISEEENRLAIAHSQTVVCRYDIATRTLAISPNADKIFDLPVAAQDVPYGSLKRGLISSDTAQDYLDFFQRIINGEKSGELVFQLKSSKGWRWLRGRFSSVFASSGEPSAAVISFSDVTEAFEKEAAYKKWLQAIRSKHPQTYALLRCNLAKETLIDSLEGALLGDIKLSQRFKFVEQLESHVAEHVVAEDRARALNFLDLDAILTKYYQGEHSFSIELRQSLPHGECRWLRLTVDLVEHSHASGVEAYLLFEDIDQEKREQLAARERAEQDALTKALNRSAFADKLNHAVKTTRPHVRHALLMLDIDGFKQVNDSFGHAAGDQALIDIVSALHTVLRPGDLVGRLGGDEFAVFIENIPSDTVAANKAKQICSLVRKSYSAEVEISGSVGIAITPRDGTDFTSLYKRADSALYYVKGSGKDNYAFYMEDMAEQHLELQAEASKHGTAKKTKKRRMLIVDDSMIDHALLSAIFTEDFIVEKAKDGNTALIRLRHYGSAISVVLLDLMMPGMDGFAVLKKMQESPELARIPVIVVSGDESHDVSLRAIRAGASDYVSKPVNAEILRIRVQSAISKADNERLRAQNAFLEYENSEVARYKTVFERSGIVAMELDWVKGEFAYGPSVSNHLAGRYDHRKLWTILLADFVAETQTVKRMQDLVHQLAMDAKKSEVSTVVYLKTPHNERRWFRMNVYKTVNEYGLADKLYLTFMDLGKDKPPA